MKTKQKIETTTHFHNIRSVLLGAVSKLDTRGNNETVTQAMCIIETTMDALLRGRYLTSSQAHRLGLVLAKK